MGAIGSLASVVRMFTASAPVKASMVPLRSNGEEDFNGERAFQYFPETIQDTRGVDYAAKKIPGGSHPLYQFIAGTDRTISFTAIFTQDENQDSGDFFDKLTKGFSLSGLLGIKEAKNTVDVAAAIAWLRTFTYPTYGNNGYAKAPPVLRLFLPNSGICGNISGRPTPDSIDVIMTQCDVTYEAFYRQGHPRIASVQLSFNETIQVGTGWKFVDAQKLIETSKWVSKYNVKSNRQPTKKLSTTEGFVNKLFSSFDSD